MARSVLHLLPLISVLVSPLSCNTAPPEGCETHIKDRISVGVSADVAGSELKKCGFTVTADPKVTSDQTRKTLYGDKRVTRGLITERTQVVITLDAKDRVVRVDVSTGLIGP